MKLDELIKHYLTSKDGETYAIGRGLGLILFFVGLGLAGFIVVKNPTVEVMQALAVYVPAWAGAVTLLIWGTKDTEPDA